MGVGKGGEKGFHHLRIELRAGYSSQLEQGIIRRPCLPIWPPGGHGIERIGDGDDAGLDGNPFPPEAIGKASSIQALVVRAHNPQHIRRLVRKGSQHTLPQRGMLGDLAKLIGGQGAGFVQDGLPGPDLPDIV